MPDEDVNVEHNRGLGSTAENESSQEQEQQQAAAYVSSQLGNHIIFID